ncbi:MAG: fumarylacetoacetate hydrolase family protein [Bacteroidetes bacterium]|jgi:2-keto-4-pentenoate hydratase/2-oxohepta-3-ene-1,7-dioic acid hydratase in catechol pathway|nr:fumarylacetoacetate hydrolase family protein [Bacteroidota bacterium]
MPTVSLDSRSIAVPKILCIGRNYAEHAKEMKAEIPSAPVFFLKPSTALVADGGVVRIPSISNDMHHEVELTVLVGTGGSHIPESEARKHIAGFGVGLDMTLRDVQAEAKKKGLPWALAKGFDTSAPVSSFVAADRVPKVASLSLELLVNGQVRQRGSLADLIFPVEQLIAYLSRFVTLEAGDIIYTGTPEGVARVIPGETMEAKLLGGTSTLTRVTVSVQ